MTDWHELKRAYLTEADQHIEAATERIAEVWAEIAEVERAGGDADGVREALEQLEAMLRDMADKRAFLAKVLEMASDHQKDGC